MSTSVQWICAELRN